jgi:putative hydroxymethylpyrimidine transport system substrate-binding protein
MMLNRRLCKFSFVIVLALLVSACGGDDETTNATNGGQAQTGGVKLPEQTQATLILDFIPNAVHAGIYRAIANGYYEENNLDLKVILPTSTSDPLRLIDAGRADIGIADGINVASLIARGRPVKGIMALTQRPLAGIITLKEDGYTSPGELEGKTVGITGDPSDVPITRTIISEGGGDYETVNVVTIGFNGVTNLESGKVDGFTGFYPADGVQVAVDGYPTTIFKLDEFGAPSYPGLVVFSTDERISEKPGVMAAFVDATIRGYEDTLEDPQASLEDLLTENPSLKREVQSAQLDAFVPLFQGNAASYGVFEEANINDFGQWLADVGLLDEPFAFEDFATNEFVDSSDG